jgi:hypothetical protein
MLDNIRFDDTCIVENNRKNSLSELNKFDFISFMTVSIL